MRISLKHLLIVQIGMTGLVIVLLLLIVGRIRTDRLDRVQEAVQLMQLRELLITEEKSWRHSASIDKDPAKIAEDEKHAAEAADKIRRLDPMYRHALNTLLPK